MKVVRVEPTPNPNAYKFIMNDAVLRRGVLQYDDAESAAENALASSLFRIEGTETVYMTQNFVTLTLDASADWSVVQTGVAKAVEEYEADDAPEEAPAASAGGDEVLGRIQAVLDAKILPYLAADGGGLEVLGMDGKTLHIRYQGACGSCPSSVAGTLMAINNLIKTEVDPEIDVINV